MCDTSISNLSLQSPHPVICCGEDESITFRNPAVNSLVQEMQLDSVASLLPNNHSTLLRKCLFEAHSLSVGSTINQRVFEWSYQAIPEENRVNIYGYEVTEHVIFESAYQSTLNNLTPTKASLAKLIAQGVSQQDAANMLEISTGTARSHLNQVFKKTRTHRQANLVQQIITGPAWVQGCAT